MRGILSFSQFNCNLRGIKPGLFFVPIPRPDKDDEKPFRISHLLLYTSFKLSFNLAYSFT